MSRSGRHSCSSRALRPADGTAAVWVPVCWLGAVACSRSRRARPPGSHQAALRDRGSDEAGEERVRFERARLEFRVELHADEPWMIAAFANLRQNAVGRKAGEEEARLLERVAVFEVHFVAVTVALLDFGLAVDLRDF